MNLNPYLNFNGNCREAFDLYQKTLGGEVLFAGTYADMPEDENADEGCSGGAFPEGWQDKIMHISLQLGNVTLMGSDIPAEHFNQPQGLHVSINVGTVEEAERIYGVLSEGGQVFMPLGETFWALRFASFSDRFGTPWMINCERPMEG